MHAEFRYIMKLLSMPMLILTLQFFSLRCSAFVLTFLMMLTLNIMLNSYSSSIFSPQNKNLKLLYHLLNMNIRMEIFGPVNIHN
ncbi:hypothetical protein VNO78_04119 [Psophocarpus tetragonolobus]|uniref:Uncharacterized protein n=1 Tax=Psophocarpus tetragonolobus TaxID=3891 RepID=A0AAN9T1I5_PSOTE